MAPEQQPVTVIVRRRVRPEHSEEFEDWLDRIGAVAQSFPGHLGVVIAKPVVPERDDWVVAFRFDTADHLADWESSEERARALAEVEHLTTSESVKVLTGLEFWFKPPPGAARQPPSPLKMALVTTVGLYPLVLWLAPAIAGQLTALPGPLQVLLTVSALVLVMTYAVMPLLTRALSFWLFARQ